MFPFAVLFTPRVATTGVKFQKMLVSFLPNELMSATNYVVIKFKLAICLPTFNSCLIYMTCSRMLVLTSRDRPKSAPYPRLKNSKKTSKCQVLFYSTRKSKFFEKNFSKKLHTQKKWTEWRAGAR